MPSLRRVVPSLRLTELPLGMVAVVLAGMVKVPPPVRVPPLKLVVGRVALVLVVAVPPLRLSWPGPVIWVPVRGRFRR